VLRGTPLPDTATTGKAGRVAAGEVFDVAVDIRRSSLTFGKWVGERLSADNKKQMWVPPGLAHGFLVLSDVADFLYKTTDYYAPEHERCIRWNDSDLNIQWPTATAPLVVRKGRERRPFQRCRGVPMKTLIVG
jgi:dTDP-4-dehydrorhamnose 3,5-epimerase